ncbi:MAG: DNA primase [Lachnospiraceae bacterium]|nr:DNA primase [Lachnospiraceae bacterium]
MYYPEEIIEEVRNRNNIVDVVGSCVNLKKKGTNYFGLCPFHNEKTPSFSVSETKQIYYCFGCGAGGNVISFVMNYENMTFQEALKVLADRAGVKLPEIEESAEEKRKAGERARILSVLKDAASFYYKTLRTPEGKAGLEYFKKRGLSPDMMHSFGLGFAGKRNEVCSFLKEKGYSEKEINDAGLVYIDEKRGMQDRFWNRVMFPIMDVNNRVIGFGGRVMGDGEPKYLNSPETVVFDKGKNLYGLNIARKSRKGYMIACEGYMDVISLHQAGFTEAVASLGTAFTIDHARILKRYTEDLRLTYDSDGAGVKAALRAIPILREAGISAKIIHLEPYKDPDEFIKNLGSEEFKKRIEDAEKSLSFEIHIMQRAYDMSDPEGRTHFQQKMAKRLAAIDNEIERNNYTEAFAAEYMIPMDVLKRAVEESRLMGDTSVEGRGAFYSRAVTDRKNKKSTVKDGVSEAQKLLLTYISEEPERIYKAVSPYISYEDFSPGILRAAAEDLFKQIEDRDIRIGAIINKFEDPEEQRQIAEVFNTTLDPELSNSEKEKALTDLVVKIKKDSLKRHSADEGDIDPIQRTIQEKKVLEKLEKMRITI